MNVQSRHVLLPCLSKNICVLNAVKVAIGGRILILLAFSICFTNVCSFIEKVNSSILKTNVSKTKAKIPIY